MENSLGAVKKLINANKKSLGQDAVAQSEHNVNLVQQRLDQVKENNNASDYPTAISSLQEAGIIAQESKDLINAKKKLKVNISVDIGANLAGDHKKADKTGDQ